MRFHVLALPHTQTLKSFSHCAYTQKVIKFCDMMYDRGHTVYLYGGEQNEAKCTEFISCILDKERLEALANVDFYVNASTDVMAKHWRIYNNNAIAEIVRRVQPTDFICATYGKCHRPIADALPEFMTVETGIGYSGTFSNYKVWESYAWMHSNYGIDKKAQWLDAVIPNAFDPVDLPFNSEQRLDYYVFLGRVLEDKGIDIAIQACKAKNARLIIAGHSTIKEFAHGEYIGVVNPEDRAKLLGNARAILCPSLYNEPFGGAAIEAMMCGTPAITTDWGAYTETVQQGVNGFRCRTLGEFVTALDKVKLLTPHEVRTSVERFTMDEIAINYEDYFKRLSTQWADGWNTL